MLRVEPDQDTRVSRIREMVEASLKHAPDATSMHSGDNQYNNDIAWDKATQVFSPDWIDWAAQRGALSLSGSPYQLEFALPSTRKLVVQTELSSKGHIDLSQGDNCFCAGTFHFDDKGYLAAIHLDSGHYRPTAEHGKYLIATLISQFYDLADRGGKENVEYFLKHVEVSVYNHAKQAFDTCSAYDILSDNYVKRLRLEEREAQLRQEKQARVAIVGSLIDKLLDFNQGEWARLNAQSPVSGKDDHKLKKDAFQANIEELVRIKATLKGVHLNEEDLKRDVLAVKVNTKKACDMSTHKNLDAFVGLFKAKVFDSQTNYANFEKTNKVLIDKVNDQGVPRALGLL